MTASTPEQMRTLADRADEAGAYEVMETGIVDELATNLRGAADQLEAVTAQRDRWAAQVIAIESVVDEHGFDDDTGTGWLPVAPIAAVLYPGEAG